MKIMLLYPKWTDEYGIFGIFAKKSSGWPPLNLAYLAAIAEKKGNNVKIIDGQVENISLEKMVDRVINYKPDIVCLTATTPFFHIVCELAKKIKDIDNQIPIIIGGAHISILKENAFEPFFDYAFIGESDESWSLFLDKYDTDKKNIKKDISEIKGIVFRDDNKQIKFTGNTEPISDIDSIPIPARHLLKMDKYKIGTLQGTKNFTTIMTIRGCPFNCIFCSRQVFGNKIRKRSPKLVIDEIKDIITRYNIRHFIFLDDTLTIDRKHVLEICNLIEKENLDITFEGSTRANLVDEEIISRMKNAGLIRISFGLESVDENIRRIMKKMVPIESYNVANKLTNKYGIETLTSCIIGLPGETIDTVKKTLSFLRDSKEIKQANISIATPYPGTELYEMAKNGDHRLKLLDEDFSNYRRYNSAVMSVGDLTPNELIDLQNDAYSSIYLAYWRWIPMFRKSGFAGCILTLSRIIKSIVRGRTEFLMIDKNYWKLK